MKKYRCPNCKQTFTGTPEKCPSCGVTLRYMQKEKPREVEEAAVMNNFSFNDPDVVKHEDKVIPVTSVESFEDPDGKQAEVKPPVPNNTFMPTGESYFDGKMIQRVGVFILWGFVMLITLGLAFPWAVCGLMRWDTKHTIIQGHRLKFTGKGIQLLGRFLLWILLTIFTLGIILLWVQIFLKQWKTKHIVFAD